MIFSSLSAKFLCPYSTLTLLNPLILQVLFSYFPSVQALIVNHLTLANAEILETLMNRDWSKLDGMEPCDAIRVDAIEKYDDSSRLYCSCLKEFFYVKKSDPFK